MKIVKRNLFSNDYYIFKSKVKSEFLYSEKIRKKFGKNHLKNYWKNYFPKEKKNFNDIFLFYKDFPQYFMKKMFIFEGSFEVEFFNLPFSNFHFEIGFNFYKKKSNPMSPTDYQFDYNTISGIFKIGNFVSGEADFLGSGEFFKSYLILPPLKTSDKCLVQEIVKWNKAEENKKKRHITCALFSIKKSKKKYFKNGQSIFCLNLSSQVGGFFLNFFSQFPFLFKINSGPEYRFQGRRDLNFL